MKNYIGLSVSPHDSSIAIVNAKGELVYAEGTERFLQVKRAWAIAPDQIGQIESILDKYCDHTLDTVIARSWSDQVASRYDSILLDLDDKINHSVLGSRSGLLTMKYMGVCHKAVLNQASLGIELALGHTQSSISRVAYDHHLTHAAAASFASPFERAICLVIDGYGEGSSIAGFVFENNQLKVIDGVEAKDASLGYFYATMCDLCGFDALKGEEWKVMGLAAYGQVDVDLYDLMRGLIDVKGTRLVPGVDEMSRMQKLAALRRPEHVPAIDYANFAATTQKVYTDILHELLGNLFELGLSDNLIITGGCGLNSSANGTVVQSTGFKELFVNSAPADDGCAVGAALLAFHADNHTESKKTGVQTPYLGSELKDAGVSRLISYCGFENFHFDDDGLFKYVAQQLAKGKIVGWVQGKAEFGPRALGNRSIIADPRFKSVKDRINSQVKFREEFRPFAPSILHEYGDEYFEHYQFSPYMERTLTFRPTVQHKVPGVVHDDGTGRLQSVSAELNPRYYRLIQQFQTLTGIPVLLNTSFNVMGKPIVHSAEDAIAVFQTSGLDLLVIGNHVFIKHENDNIKTKNHFNETEEHCL